MRNYLTSKRRHFFNEVYKLIGTQNINLLIITHILPDRIEWLDALNKIGKVNTILAIPYSCDEETANAIKESGYTIFFPDLDELKNKDFLLVKAQKACNKNPLIIIEIGGYYAQVIIELKDLLSNNLLGVIEDTEAGLRQYRKISNLPCPVISLAKSSLKRPEDFIVGPSCIQTTDWILRKQGHLLKNMRALVIGYGKIGRGLCYALKNYCTQVSVYDLNPILRIEALTEGLLIPEKDLAIKEVDIIFGATGTRSISIDELSSLKYGAILVSCSSRDNEFPLKEIKNLFNYADIDSNIKQYNTNDKLFYMISGGTPVNLYYRESAEVGPVLALIQAEIFFSILFVKDNISQNVIMEVGDKERKQLADLWLSIFVDPQHGAYK